MKLIQLILLFALAFASPVAGQDVGKVIIKNAKDTYPKIIVSLNGVRLSNDYNNSVTFNYLDEYNYKVNILQAGSRNTLSFMVYSQPNYISTYLINKDSYGNYLFGLESKTLMGDSAVVVTKTNPIAIGSIPAGTTAPAPVKGYTNTTPVASGTVTMDEDEYFDMVKTLKKEPVEKNRLEMAMAFFGPKLFLTSMVKDALKLFNLEASKLTFAKFMYPRTVDKQNYFKVFDTFTQSKSKKDMTDFMKATP